MEGKFFEGLTQMEITVGSYKGKIPTLYHDNMSLTAIYTATTSKVKPYLPHPDMNPVEFVPGRCLVAFTAFEYRKTSIDAYNEFSIACLITFRQTQIPGITVTRQLMARTYSAYVWHLPVTTEIAKNGGIELYGYPKFIADISFRKSDGWVECELAEKGTLILKLRGRELPTGTGKVMRYVTYSLKDGVPLMTNVCVNPVQYAQSMNRDNAELEIGTGHEICDELKGIGLSGKPVLYQYSPVNEAILFAGRVLMDR
ncbi:MAG: acetoacetate decarboxylase family protein [Dehalococcoidia bacterium]|nr:acetoacetate decarboxylase family protein [Dehalococcoidia bacterium]